MKDFIILKDQGPDKEQEEKKLTTEEIVKLWNSDNMEDILSFADKVTPQEFRDALKKLDTPNKTK